MGQNVCHGMYIYIIIIYYFADFVDSKNTLINKDTFIACIHNICLLTLNLVSSEITLAKKEIQIICDYMITNSKYRQ